MADEGRSVVVRTIIDAVDAALDGKLQRTVEIAEPIEMGVSSDTDLVSVYSLRELTSRVGAVRWTLSGEPAAGLLPVCHLVPPSSGQSEKSARFAKEWRSAFRYGSFYYRLGPDFVRITDTRDDASSARYSIAGSDSAVFQQLAETGVCRLADVPFKVRQALADNGLCLCSQTWLVVLPYRMRIWPVACRRPQRRLAGVSGLR
jgi:hypothetical protein